MIGRGALWAGAAVTSVALHLGLAAALGLMITPEPVPPQQMPETRLDLAAYEVQTDRVDPAVPDTEAATAGDTTPMAVGQGAVRLERTEAVAPAATTLSAGAAPATSLSTAPAPAGPAASPAALPSERLSDASAPAARLTGALPASALLPATAPPDAAPLATAQPPRAERLAPADAPQSVVAQPADPTQDRLSAAAPTGTAPLDAAPEAALSVAARPAAALADRAAPAALRPAVAMATPVDAQTLGASAARLEAVQAAIAPPAAVRPPIPTPAASLSAAPPVAAQTLGAAAAGAEVVQAAAAPTASISPAVPAPAATLSAAQPPAEALAGSAAPGETLPSRRPPLDTLALAQPSAESLGLAVPDTADLAPSTAPAEALASAATQSLASPAPPAVPQVDHATAALAWTGDADETVDEVALAAIQSFMQPSDIAALRPGQVRDALTALLASVACSRIQAAFIPETGELELRGHIPEDDLRAPVMEAVRAQMGGAIEVTDNLLILPRPQCGALAGISAVDLPQSTDQLTNPLLVGPDAHAVNHSFTEGQRMTFDLTAPDYDAYIHIDYFDADGTVIHLKPNEFAPTKLYEAKSSLTFGMLEDDGSGIEIFIGPPFGQEIAVAFATSVPLHDGDRPIREPAGPYLEWLQQRVAKARAEHPDFKGEWVYFFITTRPTAG